ncbi:unnamed protein product, partial [Urochloa humidicola]
RPSPFRLRRSSPDPNSPTTSSSAGRPDKLPKDARLAKDYEELVGYGYD